MKLSDEEVTFPLALLRDGRKADFQIKMKMYSLRVGFEALEPYLEENKLVRSLELNREPLQFEIAMKAIVDEGKRKLKEKNKELKNLKVDQGMDFKKYCKHLTL